MNANGEINIESKVPLMSDKELDSVKEAMNIERNDLVLIAVAPENIACNTLGR
jgi:hypothetical protein